MHNELKELLEKAIIITEGLESNRINLKHLFNLLSKMIDKIDINENYNHKHD